MKQNFIIQLQQGEKEVKPEQISLVRVHSTTYPGHFSQYRVYTNVPFPFFGMPGSPSSYTDPLNNRAWLDTG